MKYGYVDQLMLEDFVKTGRCFYHWIHSHQILVSIIILIILVLVSVTEMGRCWLNPHETSTMAQILFQLVPPSVSNWLIQNLSWKTMETKPGGKRLISVISALYVVFVKCMYIAIYR